MKTVGSLPSKDIADLERVLEAERIPHEVRLADEESGLDVSDLLVPDEPYDRACEILETWLEASAAEQPRASVRRCPKCQSQKWERVQDAHFEKVGLAVFRCTACGCLIPA